MCGWGLVVHSRVVVVFGGGFVGFLVEEGGFRWGEVAGGSSDQFVFFELACFGGEGGLVRVRGRRLWDLLQGLEGLITSI